MLNTFEICLTDKTVKIFLNDEETVFTVIDMKAFTDEVVLHTWRSDKDGYATAFIKRTTCHLHKHLYGLFLDHKDRDKLNNRESNLRFSTASQNGHNSKMFSNNTSGYKGVTYNANAKSFSCRIAVEGKRIHLGYFDCPVQAAIAYNEAAIKYFGEFAFQNVIQPLT